MTYPMSARFGLSVSRRAVWFGWAIMDDLLSAAQIAELSGHFHGLRVGDSLLLPRCIAAVLPAFRPEV